MYVHVVWIFFTLKGFSGLVVVFRKSKGGQYLVEVCCMNSIIWTYCQEFLLVRYLQKIGYLLVWWRLSFRWRRLLRNLCSCLAGSLFSKVCSDFIIFQFFIGHYLHFGWCRQYQIGQIIIKDFIQSLKNLTFRVIL